MKRRLPAQEDHATKKRCVSHATFSKWKADLDKQCHTMSWLDSETEHSGPKKTVIKLKCKVCTKFESKIQGRRNYNNKWIVGADSIRISNIKDHALSDQHAHAMLLVKKERAIAASEGPSSWAPIASALHELPADTRGPLRVKFDIAYFVATEQLAFTKYPSICELEARHGVDVGTSYLNHVAGKTFCHYIAESRRVQLTDRLSNDTFFSILMDGSTDKGNIDDELFLVVWCNTDGSDEKVHTEMSYLSVARPKTVNAQGLFDCMQSSLQRLGISEISADQCKLLVGVGTDGASSNIAAGGLKGMIDKELPWVFWNWCLAHRLELAIKDALKGSSFDLIDEMILRLYYIYEKSPQKMQITSEGY